MTRLAFMLLAAAMLTGCPNDGAAPSAPSAAPTTPTPTSSAIPGLSTELARYHWHLQDATDAQGRRIEALFARTDKPLQVDFRDGRIGITNSCNQLGAKFEMTEGGVRVAPMTSTRKACPDPKLMALDGEVSRRLAGSLSLGLSESQPPQLRLTNQAGDTLTFKAEPTAETRYGGPGERIFLEVAAQTAPCSHPLIPDKQCLQVREVTYDDKGMQVGTPGAFRNFYGDIQGYAHEAGVRNVLRVDRYKVKDPPADASSLAYVLDMVVSSDASGK